jgi:hypothetical protein
MPSGRASGLCRIPIVQPSVFGTISGIVVIAPRSAYLIVKIFRHPSLCAYLNGVISFAVSAIGE